MRHRLVRQAARKAIVVQPTAGRRGPTEPGDRFHAKGVATLRQAASSLSWQSASPPAARAQLSECLLDSAAQAISKHSGDSCLSKSSGVHG